MESQGTNDAVCSGGRHILPEVPKYDRGRHVRGQLFRAATGTAANYRAVCRSKTDPDLIAKFGTVIEEADESAFWLEFGTRAGLTKRGDERSLLGEANELVAIFMQGRKTARKNLAQTGS